MGQCELEKTFVVPTSSTDKELGQVPLGAEADVFKAVKRTDKESGVGKDGFPFLSPEDGEP